MTNKLQILKSAVRLDDRYISTKRHIAELTRKLTFKKHVVSIFLQLDDPYSYLLGHYLSPVVQRYNSVDFRFFVCQALRGEHMPEPALLAEYAVSDCRSLARELGVAFLDKGDAPAVEHRRALLEFLAAEQVEQDFGQTMISALTYYWRGDVEGVARMIGRTYGESAETSVLIGRNQLLLRKMGHYNCATMHYAGEWYWGVDRLGLLIERLDKFGLNRFGEAVPEVASLEQAIHLNLPATPPSSATALPALEYFHSFRSPYSYIGLQQACSIADAFGLRLEIKPVLPMLMRGLAVPRLKEDCGMRDAKREATRRNVPFRRVSDPLGLGVERCMAAFKYAKEQSRQRDFVIEVGRAVFSEAIDVATDEGMQKVAKRAGLDWPELQTAMRSDEWRDDELMVRQQLSDIGLWGVPVFKNGDHAVWGQDRGWLIARQIEDLCHSGEGIII